jgi:hypothetical protein
MKYFIKNIDQSCKSNTKPNAHQNTQSKSIPVKQPKQLNKKILSSISEKELIRLKRLKEITKPFLNLTIEEHKDFVVEVADVLSLDKKFVITEEEDFVSDIFINDKENFIRVITNKEILTPDDIFSFMNKIIDVDPKEVTLITSAVYDRYFDSFSGSYMIFHYTGLEFADFLKSYDLINN